MAPNADDGGGGCQLALKTTWSCVLRDAGQRELQGVVLGPRAPEFLPRWDEVIGSREVGRA